jgi:hypothetical protein
VEVGEGLQEHLRLLAVHQLFLHLLRRRRLEKLQLLHQRAKVPKKLGKKWNFLTG